MDSMVLPDPALYGDLLDLDHREEARRRNGLDASVSDDADNENRNDLKRRVLGPRLCELGSADIGHRGDDASGRVILRSVDLLDRAAGVAVIEGNELLDLLACVAYQALRHLDLLRLSPEAQRQQQRQSETHALGIRKPGAGHDTFSMMRASNSGRLHDQR